METPIQNERCICSEYMTCPVCLARNAPILNLANDQQDLPPGAQQPITANLAVLGIPTWSPDVIPRLLDAEELARVSVKAYSYLPSYLHEPLLAHIAALTAALQAELKDVTTAHEYLDAAGIPRVSDGTDDFGMDGCEYGMAGRVEKALAALQAEPYRVALEQRLIGSNLDPLTGNADADLMRFVAHEQEIAGYFCGQLDAELQVAVQREGELLEQLAEANAQLALCAENTAAADLAQESAKRTVPNRERNNGSLTSSPYESWVPAES